MSATKPTRQELRKQLVRLRMEMHRHELRHETHQLLQPLRQMRGSAKTWQGTLSSVHAPAWGMAAVTALGFFGAKTKKLSRWLKIGLSLYPVISVALKSRPPR
ncbi:hypothetical protein [Pseudomonas turukhanskensis]|uniref:YqjK-like protein n=1 Tax=Pseudomonas turukhanskensis TaxID=1806536 RepID=A0A9W6NFG7_9PSED|nr:hypothetical protein [Pseudomonas turukhanskensis]GLK88812.1 hypothetical protein GCM10017655_18740 [Pseudomonas turukhanskensis]